MGWISSLHLAAMGGHVEIAELLLSHGAGMDKTARRICGCKRTTLNCADRHHTAPGLWKQGQNDQKFYTTRDARTTICKAAVRGRDTAETEA
jgi:ankyrin repeat protein